MPAQDLTVSPQHRILVGGRGQLPSYFDAPALAPAKALTGLPGIRYRMGKKRMNWVHFACARHEVVIATGCFSESLLLGPMVIEAMSRPQRDRLREHYGAPARPGAALNGPPAIKLLSVNAVRRRLATGPGRRESSPAFAIASPGVKLAPDAARGCDAGM